MLHKARRLGAPGRNARFSLKLSRIQGALNSRIHETPLRTLVQQPMENLA